MKKQFITITTDEKDDAIININHIVSIYTQDLEDPTTIEENGTVETITRVDLSNGKFILTLWTPDYILELLENPLIEK